MIDTGFYNSDPDPNANSYNGNSTHLTKMLEKGLNSQMARKHPPICRCQNKQSMAMPKVASMMDV